MISYVAKFDVFLLALGELSVLYLMFRMFPYKELRQDFWILCFIFCVGLYGVVSQFQTKPNMNVLLGIIIGSVMLCYLGYQLTAA